MLSPLKLGHGTNDYIPQFYVDVIAYPYSNLDM